MEVFLSYPCEHQIAAMDVKNFVRSVGANCWFDKESLIPGEDWDRARKIALEVADVVVILCATQTNERNGVYQRELNEALRLQSDKRLGSVYLIPLRIEDVTLPPELLRLQYADYFDPSWRRQLAAGLERAAEQMGKLVPLSMRVAASKPDEGNLISRLNKEKCNEATIEIEWHSYTLQGEFWEFLNGVIASRALGALYESRRMFNEWWKPGGDYHLKVFEFYRKGEFVSLMFSTSEYFNGAAHPNHRTETINVLGREGGIMKASEFFDPTDEAFKFLNDYVNLDLKRQSQGESILDLSYYMNQYGWSF